MNFQSLQKLVLFSAIFFSPLLNTAHAGGVLRPRSFLKNPQLLSQVASGKVAYFGGPVLSHVKVEMVLWGKGVSTEAQQKLAAFYSAIVNSAYLDQLSEYSTDIRSEAGAWGTKQTIGRGSFAGAHTIAPKNTSRSLTQSDIEQELEFQVASGALPAPSADSVYMIHYPKGYSINISFGKSCVAWAADHEVYKSAKFGNIYYAVFPCDSADLSNFDELTLSASHELAEAVTDPVSPLADQPAVFPAAWLTNGDLQEIGDLCAWRTSELTSKNQGSFKVQQEWLNTLNGCNPANFVEN